MTKEAGILKAGDGRDLWHYLQRIGRQDSTAQELDPGVATDLERGATEEDTLTCALWAISMPIPCRPLNHFHDPLLPFVNAGLALIDSASVQIGESSALWSQDPNQGDGGDYSWQHARNAYYDALTEAEPAAAYSELFVTLGHLLHLVQDSASPAHTRNDMHLGWCNGLAFMRKDSFHRWAEKNKDAISVAADHFQKFDSSILRMPLAPETSPDRVPVPALAHIIDSEQYRQNNMPRTDLAIGLAEYSNANFFSDDTVFPMLTNPLGRQYPHPGRDDLFMPEQPDVDPDTGRLRYYYRRQGSNERVATPSALRGYVYLAETPKGLDDTVMADYGAALFPRAIGYGAGLLDYFFRGTLSVEMDGSNVGREEVSDLHMSVKNSTPDETAEYGHVLVAVDGVTGGGSRFHRVSENVPVNLAGLPVELDLSFSPPIPADARDVRVTTVYRGKLGTEGDAIAVASQTLATSAFLAPLGTLRFGDPWKFEPNASLQYGNVDWLGKNGMRLSWVGPWGRYLLTRPTAELTPHIFSEGRLLTDTPGLVIGAAEHETADGRTLLIAVTTELDASGNGVRDVFWTRELPISDDHGWIQIGEWSGYSNEYALGSIVPVRSPSHWFFNASGTEATTQKAQLYSIMSPSGNTLQRPWRRVTARLRDDDSSVVFAIQANDQMEFVPNDQEYHPASATIRAEEFMADYIGDEMVTAAVEATTTIVEDYSPRPNGCGETYTWYMYSAVARDLVTSKGDREHFDDDVEEWQGSWMAPCNWDPVQSWFTGTTTVRRKLLEYVDLRTSPPFLVFRDSSFDQSSAEQCPGCSWQENHQASWSLGISGVGETDLSLSSPVSFWSNDWTEFPYTQLCMLWPQNMRSASENSWFRPGQACGYYFHGWHDYDSYSHPDGSFETAVNQTYRVSDAWLDPTGTAVGTYGRNAAGDAIVASANFAVSLLIENSTAANVLDLGTLVGGSAGDYVSPVGVE